MSDTLPPLQGLAHASLDWQAQGPIARDYQDVYFSRDDGQAETRYVFIEQNLLPQRLAQWQQKRAFVIGETGFGTGLNLLCAWQALLDYAPPGTRLHFISVERHPLSHVDLSQALTSHPNLAPLAARLLAQYPEAVSGVHRLQLSERVSVDLLLGEAAEMLSLVNGPVDSWFLDGFAPAKNPQMWSSDLFQALARLSHPETHFATFTAAGVVKRGLKAVGFEVRKVAGFGHKRDMLRGQFRACHWPHPEYRQTPWLTPHPSTALGRIVIIGAGLAGLSTAEALTRRGYCVTILDAEGPGAGGSGNRQGALYIKLAVETNLQSRFYLNGLQYSRRWLTFLDPQQQFWQDSGVLQLAMTEKEQQRQARFIERHPNLPPNLLRSVTAAEASERAGLSLSHGGLWYGQAGWVRPGALCQWLCQHPGIDYQQGQVIDLQRGPHDWQLRLSDQRQLNADTVIVATAAAARTLPGLDWLPTKAIRGQVSHGRLTDATPTPQCVICAGGYVSPSLEHQLCFGATFNLHESSPHLRVQDHQYNLEELAATLPDTAKALIDQGQTAEQLEGRVAFRCASPDYSPIVGQAPDIDDWQQGYAVMGQDATRIPPHEGKRLPGLWLNLGHGSRGLASTPLAAELLASQLCGEPWPMESALAHHLDPGRLVIRQIIRQGHVKRSV
ncbi:hypothetical protein BFW38_11895 [Terasakiispira papahanaumokuakeensis]|uniref:tRNA 5-methylaminomethyl-2-thiouridine biosynthesis bifunctional protein MnmC n=1 Tax=Terasakiispira papahanaumokuakeensis TaxID=197479 RepID=A0A1E2VB91_9GAMM|nr:bifunctional tRNA (5-methylaminomethyl-2-thiouridine)(34)-methyltransferase MnmD/FAD-dependent 5-carboxymethylaminomethyl-2-thiouridine(34) oxidoreductase MnmC [Terasakiispira papahanaumokuakeensis]ODC04122.1 hypothetical protein BFW38_11895 [Terasakiispira papahanaumokuakeensis]